MLKALINKTTTIEIPGGAIAFRAFSMEDIFTLVANHRSQAEAIYETTNTDKSILDVLKTAPELCADAFLLGLVGDEEGLTAEDVRKLPVGIQVLALTTILELTFESAGGLKNVFKVLTELMQSVTPKA
jgi:hypothetical protein